jgi:cell fate regulator YaaT (PSP1 superfamily)
MIQVGARDEAGWVGGVGICGRTLCCSTWLKDFRPISIQMAKRQSLSLNPSKISGQCGRLLCCLAYEDDQYKTRNPDGRPPAPQLPELPAESEFG